MYRENYINSLRAEILEMVAEKLTPVALKYGYSDSPLETNIKWRPLVLVLGNYSSGKSTLINEFLEADIQATGQAPTDDSFTILTYDDTVAENNGGIRTVEERDGKFLLNDPEFPFESLKKHGQRFAAHFKLKKSIPRFLKISPLLTRRACWTASPSVTGDIITRKLSVILPILPILCWSCSIRTRQVPFGKLT